MKYLFGRNYNNIFVPLHNMLKFDLQKFNFTDKFKTL